MRTSCPLSWSQKLRLSESLTQRLQRVTGRPVRENPLIKIREQDAKLAQDLQKGAIDDPTLQPFLAHVPFVLQFFIEFAIFGMDFIEFKKIYFRKTAKDIEKYEMSLLSPQSNVAVEFDAHVDDILNPKAESECSYVNSGLRYVWEDERRRRKLANLEEPQVVKDTPRPRFVGRSEVQFSERLLTKMDKKSWTNMTKMVPNRADLDSSLAFEEEQVSQGGLENEVKVDAVDDDEDDELGFTEDVENDALSEISADSLPDRDNLDDLESTDSEEEDNFVGWACPVLKPARPGISRTAVQQADKVGIKPRSVDHNYRGSFGDMTVNSRFLEEACPSASPAKPLHKSETTSTVDHLCAMSLELVVESFSGDPAPNPQADPVVAVAVAVCRDVCNWKGTDPFDLAELVVWSADQQANKDNVQFVHTEFELMEKVCTLVQRFDPDIFIGYDMVRESWTYLTQRAICIQFPIARMISRVKAKSAPSLFMSPETTIDKGRISLETWRIVRREHPLRSYEHGYVVGHLLGKPCAQLKFDEVQAQLKALDPNIRLIPALWTLKKAKLNISILEAMDIFVKTSQMARILGIQFNEVLTRGSQFRVESMLLRLAKRRGFMAPMGSPETIPLNLEPESDIYRDPVVVLDFQSLYPSVGRWEQVNSFSGGRLQLGALEYDVVHGAGMSSMLRKGQLHISPTGGVFVKPAVRKGLLGEMLMELLDTRVMVKESMKKHKGDQRMLDAQQLALKLVANVTYGYTAANWSGRMPCEEVADAIVSKGREALERVIEMINKNRDKYAGATVVYGDTDSVFVLFRGSTRSEAFKLGRQIAADATRQNPAPMKLKFEKVMQPCALLTKKRYVGMSYEKEDEPGVFDAKGIETVRRDGSPFVAKLLEKCLRVLFDHNPQTAVNYLRSRLANIHNCPISDFVINAEFRGEYAEKAQVPAKKLALELKAECDRLNPVRGERLAYVLVRPEPGLESRLIDCVCGWAKFQRKPDLQLHYNYYVGKHLMSTLKRFFDLVPIRLKFRPIPLDNCKGCGQVGNPQGYCKECTRDRVVSRARLAESAINERRLLTAKSRCRDCLDLSPSQDPFDLSCLNFECPQNQIRTRVNRNMAELYSELTVDLT